MTCTVEPRLTTTPLTLSLSTLQTLKLYLTLTLRLHSFAQVVAVSIDRELYLKGRNSSLRFHLVFLVEKNHASSQTARRLF